MIDLKAELQQIEKAQYQEFAKLANENEIYFKYSDSTAHDQRSAVIQRAINELQIKKNKCRKQIAGEERG